MFAVDIKFDSSVAVGKHEILCKVDSQHNAVLGLAMMLGKRVAAGDCEPERALWTLQLFGDRLGISGVVHILIGKRV